MDDNVCMIVVCFKSELLYFLSGMADCLADCLPVVVGTVRSQDRVGWSNVQSDRISRVRTRD